MTFDTASSSPLLKPLCRIEVEVADMVSLGSVPQGERRYVPLTGGTVSGALTGKVRPGGTDWQLLRADGVLEIAAHYVLELDDGSLVEVDSRGLRHGLPEVMQRLAKGEPVAPHEYFFRTFIRLATGAPGWQRLNNVMAVAVASRQQRRVVLELHELG
jgi:hypothetical protein